MWQKGLAWKSRARRWTCGKGLFLGPSLFPKPQDKESVVVATFAVIEASHDHCPHYKHHWSPALDNMLDSEPSKPKFLKLPHGAVATIRLPEDTGELPKVTGELPKVTQLTSRGQRRSPSGAAAQTSLSQPPLRDSHTCIQGREAGLQPRHTSTAPWVAGMALPPTACRGQSHL